MHTWSSGLNLECWIGKICMTAPLNNFTARRIVFVSNMGFVCLVVFRFVSLFVYVLD